MAAVQHETKDRYLDAGFERIVVPSKQSVDSRSHHKLKC